MTVTWQRWPSMGLHSNGGSLQKRLVVHEPCIFDNYLRPVFLVVSFYFCVDGVEAVALLTSHI